MQRRPGPAGPGERNVFCTLYFEHVFEQSQVGGLIVHHDDVCFAPLVNFIAVILAWPESAKRSEHRNRNYPRIRVALPPFVGCTPLLAE